MFEKLDPRKGEMLKLLNENGTLEKDAKDYPLMDKEELHLAYKTMLLARIADEWAVSLNRQGRISTYAPNKGQEANSIGTALAIDRDDWYVLAFRELGGMLLRGIPLRQYYLYWMGHEDGSRFKREDHRILPICVPIGTQTPHAVGLAYAEKYLKSGRATIGFVGDGGTSEGDFLEACNFAGVWKVPVILFIQNNQWAISVPRKMQTASKTLAEKAFAFGFEGVQVDGNDVMAVFAATSLARKKAAAGEGPTLIEGVTYRLGAHTTADDPTRYREDKEVEEWLKRDPLPRLEKYLMNEKIITPEEVQDLTTEYKKKAMEEFEEAEKYQALSLEETFIYTFKEMPPILRAQMERKAFLRKGNSK